VIDPSSMDDELARLGVLQELTVAATQLFDPAQPVSDFLDRLAVRFNTVVALCAEFPPDLPPILLGDAGLSAHSRALPLPPLDPADNLPPWPFPELAQPLACWSFELDHSPGEARRVLLLFFGENPPTPPRYQAVIRRLCRTLSAALRHRYMLAQSLASERRIAEQAALLQAQNDLIRAANAELERRVAERTRELTAANAVLSSSLASLHETQEQLLRAGKLAAIGTLVAGIAHEINNPLSYTTANLEMLLEQLPSLAGSVAPAPLAELVGMADDAFQGAERVRGIVLGLQKFSRVGAVQRSLVDLRRLLLTAGRLLQPELAGRASLDLSIDENLPPVFGDEIQLSQVFANLLSNAAQAIHPGNPAANRVSLAAHATPDGHVLVEIHDSGVGIHEALLPRIFDPFFTTKVVGEGTGLGLSICHGIVTSHGGEILVRSTVGKGTSFSVSLPRARPG